MKEGASAGRGEKAWLEYCAISCRWILHRWFWSAVAVCTGGSAEAHGQQLFHMSIWFLNIDEHHVRVVRQKDNVLCHGRNLDKRIASCAPIGLFSSGRSLQSAPSSSRRRGWPIDLTGSVSTCCCFLMMWLKHQRDR